jgi:RNA polymerase sigma factor (sigma-70 family)
MQGILDTGDDAALIAAVRQGRSDLYGELYARYVAAATAYGRRLTRNGDDADEIVAEAFTRLLVMIRRGAGPVDEFRPYLMRTVRNLAFDRSRSERKVELTDQTTLLEGVEQFVDPVEQAVDRALLTQAFVRLPPRWQQVLWLTCVLGHGIEQAGEALGLNASAVTSLAYRAREGLRQEFLQALVPVSLRRSCDPHAGRLGALVRGGLGAGPRRRVELHLTACRPCRRTVADLHETNGTLRTSALGVFRSTTDEPGRRTSGRPHREDDGGWAGGRVA